MSLDDLGRKLAGKQGPEYWKTLDELADDADLRRWMDDEFPNRESLAGLNRRDLLKFMGASLALAGLSGCRGMFMPQRKLVPYVDGPNAETYGQQLFFRTSMAHQGYGFGLHVASREGRPIKIEGSPDHPASLGACDPVSQAALLEFYDPDRLRTVGYAGDTETWDHFFEAFLQHVQTRGADGVRVLTGTVTSPTLTRRLAAFVAAHPGARLHAYEPLGRQNTYQATQAVFGRPLAPVYRADRADVVLGVDYDLSDAGHGAFAFSRPLMARRRSVEGINRIYGLQAAPTLLGAVADHVSSRSPIEIERTLRTLAGAVGLSGEGAGEPDAWTSAVARDLMGATGRAAVLVGEQLSPTAQALGHAINARIGAIGATVGYIEPPETSPIDQGTSLRELVDDMAAGRVTALLILGGNPVYDAPPSLGFTEALERVPLRVFHGLHANETATRCDWMLPACHFLEEWGDLRAFDGTVSLVQPLIAPLFDGRSTIDLLSRLSGESRRGDALVRETWGDRLAGDAWREALRVGVVTQASPSPTTPQLAASFSPSALIGQADGFAVVVRPDPYMRDGRYANNGWLQELPKPLTGLTWDNAVLLSPRTAADLKVGNGDHVDLQVNGRTVRGPVWITPGHADGCATAYLGGGRTEGGVVAKGTGFDAYPLLTAPGVFSAVGTLKPASGSASLVETQMHHRLEGRDLIHTVSTNGHRPEPQERGPMFYDLTDEITAKFGGPQWAMTIDLSLCIGCNACVAACQAENNIPVVGKEQVAAGREMHWIRVDRYYQGDAEAPRTYFQPVPCMHCETAPCEPVCPVAATVHSHEGLNQMIYNRCVGTRYCSNNCPYKVRRFNFLNYQLQQPNYPGRSVDLLRLLNNPDVSVRSRGVMEKCSYCVQRINRARIAAKEEGRSIRDGEVVTACQQACPTETIVFGDLTDPNSRVQTTRRDARSYSLLPELNTRPRTTYLARVENPNPAMEAPRG